ncbi:MAG: hypothetical protein AAFX79_12160 [Planctomycetota bacterium]
MHSSPARALAAAFAALVAGSLAGCHGDAPLATETEPAGVLAVANETCPIGGHAVTEEGGYAIHDGQKVGFCCDQCRVIWVEDMTEAERSEALAEVL